MNLTDLYSIFDQLYKSGFLQFENDLNNSKINEKIVLLKFLEWEGQAK